MTILSYKTVKQHSTYEIEKIKGSRFIGNIFNIQNETDIKDKLDKCRISYPNACHHCFAWILSANTYRYSDDGEPAGSAGKPIFMVLQGHKLQYTLLVVSRVFGGTKLGVGGLVQAYSNTAKQTIIHTNIIDKQISRNIYIQYQYEQINTIKSLIKKYDIRIIKEKFEETITSYIEINAGLYDQFISDLVNYKIAILDK